MAMIRWMPTARAELGQAHDGVFHFRASQHHQIGQLVDYADDVRQFPYETHRLARLAFAVGRDDFAVLDALVVDLDIANAQLREQPRNVPPFQR